MSCFCFTVLVQALYLSSPLKVLIGACVVHMALPLVCGCAEAKACIQLFTHFLALWLDRMNDVCGLGRGNYFATHSSYSHDYAAPGPKGVRKMLFAKVLIGRYTQGNSQMVTERVVFVDCGLDDAIRSLLVCVCDHCVFVCLCVCIYIRRCVLRQCLPPILQSSSIL